MGKETQRSQTQYHHGNLRAALIQATLELIQEGGPQNVTVSEAARRAGVSSGAPFRHFANRTALMTAVAEEAMNRFYSEMVAALQRTQQENPLQRLRAAGAAYLHWALTYPTYFQIISDRNLIDFAHSEALNQQNQAIRGMVHAVLEEAKAGDWIGSIDLATAQLTARALVYGLARMYTDGHFAQWDVAEDQASAAINNALDLFIAGLAKR